MGDIFTTMGFEASKQKLGSDRLMQLAAQSNNASKLNAFIKNIGGYEDITRAERVYRKLMGVKFEFVSTAKGESPFDS